MNRARTANAAEAREKERNFVRDVCRRGFTVLEEPSMEELRMKLAQGASAEERAVSLEMEARSDESTMAPRERVGGNDL